MITHDLGIVAEICDEVAVMYGNIVEKGTLEDVFLRTKHLYTEGLFNSIPLYQRQASHAYATYGLPPDPTPEGCAFRPRCPYAGDDCTQPQTAHRISDTHYVRCSAYYSRPGFHIKRGADNP